MSRVAGFGIRH